MAKGLVEQGSLTAIADAIRAKGVEGSWTPSQMPDAIASIEGGGSTIIEVTGDLSYAFGGDIWENSPLNIHDVTNLSYSFFGNKGTTSYSDKEIKCTSSIKDVSYMFQNNTNRTSLPKITIEGDWTLRDARSMFENCINIRTIPDDWLPSPTNIDKSGRLNRIFAYDSRLLSIPAWYYDILSRATNRYEQCPIYYAFFDCGCVREITNLLFPDEEYIYNMFNNSFNGLNALRHLTFQPGQVRRWKNQSIDVSSWVGHGDSYDARNIPSTWHVIKDATTYEQYKNDYDSFAQGISYATYNHDSAVETINSLPDTSAYLAAKGGTNYIVFYGSAGSATDAGAINTLTDEEIAAATSKGWTVSFR